LKKTILLLTLLLAIVLVQAQDETNDSVLIDNNIAVPDITDNGEVIIPSVGETTTSTLSKVKTDVMTNPGRYILGFIIILILIYFIYKALDKDEEKLIDKYYRKAADLHKTAEEYHKDGFPNLAEQTMKKAEKYRQKAREVKATL